MAVSGKNGVSADCSARFLQELRERALEKKTATPLDGDGGAASRPESAPELLEELSTHQIELEMQNEELRLAQADLAASRARYLDLYDLAPVGYLTVDEEGAIVEMNLRAGFLLGATRAVLNGRKFSRLIVSEDQAMYSACRQRLRKASDPQSCELRMTKVNRAPFWARLEMSLGDGDSIGLCRIVIVEITERKIAELQVQDSERRLHQLANAMPQIVWTSAPGGNVDYYNERWYEYTGCAFEQAKGRGWQCMVHASDLPACLETAISGFAAGTPFEFKCRLKRASDGAYLWHLGRAVPYRDQGGAILRWVGTFTDIHEQELAKGRLETEVLNRTQALEELQAHKDELRRSLNEKQTLLSEVHHRVKNNLQVISSLLRIQGSLVKDKEAAAALKDSEQRVASMAMIHERLYGGRQMDQLDFGEYTQTLVNDLFDSYAGPAHHVVACLNTERVLLKVDQAISCGLILNELVTNALKHAYPEGEKGEVVIDLRETAAGLVTLSVSDQGVGLPAGLNWQNSDSMGLPIVDLLTQQIGGALKVRTSPGAAFSIEFLKDSKNGRAASA